jgi:AcrR family transcriptional regulator
MLSTDGRKRAPRGDTAADDAPRKSDLTRERVVAAARALFDERGFAETTIQDVADRAGVGKATVYYYVESKGQLLGLVIDETIGELLTQVRCELERIDSPAKGLDHLLRRHAREMARTGVMLDAYLRGEAASEGRLAERMGPARATYVGLLCDLIERGIAAGEFRAMDPDAAARMVAGCVVGTFLHWSKFDRPRRPAPDADALVLFIMGGLGYSGEGR